jgi:hypothetical protein
MIHSRLRWLFWLVAFGVAGCIGTVTPTPTPAPPSVTLPPPTVATPAPSLTAIPLPSDTASPVPTLALPPTDTDTPVPTLAAPTPIPSPVSPSINSFTIAPAQIQPGGSVTLTWSAIGEQATLWRLDPLGRLSEWYDVPLSDSIITTTSPSLRYQVTFMLFVTSGAAHAQASLSATITCPDAWFFPNPPANDCPASPPNYTTMAAQHFEHGLMLWTQFNDRIFILYDDNPDAHFRHWTIVSNAWLPGLPESDPNIVPPPGYYQPVRGFGVAWRDEQGYAGHRVRDRLGWATDAEFPMSGAYQCNAAFKYRTCYVTGPGEVVYVLEPEGAGWLAWAGPTPAP